MVQDSSATAGKVVILAVDSASGLHAEEYSQDDYIPLLRRALIRKVYHRGGIFVVFSASDSRSLDESNPSPFPPFVLTQSFDAFWLHHCAELKMDEVSACKFVVSQSNESKPDWDTLVLMGRPLWAATLYDGSSASKVISFAAKKLLGGGYNYNEESMFGVSSLLCRLGLRWRMWAPQSSRSVSRFMATLQYLSPTGEGRLSTYASDPVLAMGATTNMWDTWGNGKCSLSYFMLPQLKKLLNERVLKVDSVIEVVARIMLLLVMDASAVVEQKAESHSECNFRGEFVSVQTFLETFGGGAQVPLMWSSMTPVDDRQLKTGFNEWIQQWTDWQLGFYHFIELELAPTEETLWFLLARRAAGVFSREEDGADLLIPIFKGEEVSMILVQVKGAKGRCNFPDSATEDMHPSNLFYEENALSKKSSRGVIRVYMDPSEQAASSYDPDRFFVAVAENDFIGSEKPEPCTTTPKVVFIFCVRSVGPWEIVHQRNRHPVISTTVASHLVDLASSRWDLLGLIERDLSARRSRNEAQSY